MKHFHNKEIDVKEAENQPTAIFRKFCSRMAEAASMNRCEARLTSGVICTQFTSAITHLEKWWILFCFENLIQASLHF